jgi:hypothetical protein
MPIREEYMSTNNERQKIGKLDPEKLIDECLYKYDEDRYMGIKHIETKNLLLKYLKAKDFPRRQVYTQSSAVQVWMGEAYQTKQRERRLNYLKMLRESRIDFEMLDKFVQVGCLSDLKYLDRILFMIDTNHLKTKDIINALNKNIPIIDTTIKIEQNNFKKYCENQKDSFLEKIDNKQYRI